MRRAALILTLITVVLLGALGTATAGAASPWTLTNLNLGDGETIFGMHCEPSGFCVGVGQEGVVIQSTSPTGGASAWTVGHVGYGEDLRGNLRGITCPSSGLCVAVDFSGGIWTTTDSGAGAGSWTGVKLPKGRALFGIDCQTTSQCVVVGSYGAVYTTADPTGGAAAWKRIALPGEPPLRSVTCTGNLCVASAYDGELWVSHDPGGGVAAWSPLGQPVGDTPLLGVDCLSETLCTVGAEGNVLTTSEPTVSGTRWLTTPLPSRFPVVATDCVQTNLCVLSTNNGEIHVAGNPFGGPAAWLTEHLIKGVTNALFGLSCPTETLCVAAGKFGQILTSTQPNATGQPVPPPPPPPPAPPTTVLVHGPRKLIRIGAHAEPATVSFNFGAVGNGPFFYRCKYDQHPGATCRAPRKMRVGTGRHVFRIRAFGPGGGSAKTIVYRFEVERARPRPKPAPRRHRRPPRRVHPGA